MKFFLLTRISVLTTAIILGLGFSHPVGAQLEQVASGVSTGVMIQQISGELRSVISKATADGDFIVMRGGQEALFVLDGFKAANNEVLNTAFSKIGKERQAVLNRIRDATSDLEKGRVNTLEKLEGITDQIDTLVRDTSFKKQPVIYRYRGSLVIPGETQPVRLRIQGYRLVEGNPYLTFRGKRYSAVPDTNDLKFELPRALFSAKEKDMVSESALLVLWKKPDWFWQDLTEVRVTLNIVTLPSSLATVKVTYETTKEVPNERPFSEEVNHNSSSKSWDCRSFAYSPATAERRFDVSRSYVRDANHGNSRGRLQDISVRDVGISFRICAKRGYTDRNNGFRHALVGYVETWKTYEPILVNEKKLLSWKKSASFLIPDGAKKLLITAIDFSGDEKIVPTSGGKAGRYVDVTFDAQSDAVIAAPIIPNDMRSL